MTTSIARKQLKIRRHFAEEGKLGYLYYRSFSTKADIALRMETGLPMLQAFR